MDTKDQYEWMTLQTFASEIEAEPLLSLLKENQLTYQIIEDAHQGGDSLNLELQNRGITVFHVQVFPKDLERAGRILELSAGKEVQEIEDDDYISAFSNDELLEILKQPDEWNKVDYQLALKFMRERGHAIDDAQLSQWMKERIAQLEKPDIASAPMMIAGYLFAVVGGIIGLLIGMQLVFFRKRLPDGRKVQTYSEKDRNQGRIMMAISVIAMAAITVLFTR